MLIKIKPEINSYSEKKVKKYSEIDIFGLSKAKNCMKATDFDFRLGIFVIYAKN